MPIEIILKYLANNIMRRIDEQANMMNEICDRHRILVSRNQDDLKLEIEKKYGRLPQKLNDKFAAALSKLHRDYEEKKVAEGVSLASIVSKMETNIKKFRDQHLAEYLPWDDPFWDRFEHHPDGNNVPIIRFAEISLEGPCNQNILPAFLNIITNRNVLINVSSQNRVMATTLAKSIVLRLLATIQAGKAHFTFIDPIELGANMACFMDLPEHIVGGKIWTKSNHIEKRLTEITEHIEGIIQKYLKNKYRNIEEYNNDSDGVVIPYNFIIIEHFPEKFTDAAMESLIAIINNGIRSGVYTIIVRNEYQSLPPDFPIEDLEGKSIIIDCGGDKFVWRDSELMNCPISMDKWIEPERLTKLIGDISEAALASNTIEVPYDIAEKDIGNIWSKNNDTVISVPIGRMSAKSIKYFVLGRGMAQHVMIVGKTGSGKSTLLHVMIMSLCLSYTPDDLELFLIDFKKGIEFKDYASLLLPHAKVVAIQSEREFGHSVLKELNTELQRRGDLFRSCGVHSLRDFRRKNGSGRMSRILLVADEFQEFFVEDDQISWECAELLDRLVRQGRAFGIHVVLSTQTLNGLYRISKATIDQMTVKIALQCSDADSRAALGDDNPAAKLLRYPGEAIYNESNGLVEGNDFFQTFLLTEENRRKHIKNLCSLYTAKYGSTPSSQIVFEGNEPARIENNRELQSLIEAPRMLEDGKLKIWLGEPIAILPHTGSVLELQSGANLLIVGQNEMSASAMMLASFVALTAQTIHQGAEFHIVNLSKTESLWGHTLEVMTTHFKNRIVCYNRKNITVAIEYLRNIIREREDSYLHAVAEKRLFLLFFGIHRARDLRSSDGYSYTKEAEKLIHIVENGPEMGIHTLCWVDSYKNIEKVLGRKGCRFDLRVALQMSIDESNNVIDSPLANQLGPYRAIFHDFVKSDHLEKFRPYALPSNEWIGKTELMLATSFSAHI